MQNWLFRSTGLRDVVDSYENKIDLLVKVEIMVYSD